MRTHIQMDKNYLSPRHQIF